MVFFKVEKIKLLICCILFVLFYLFFIFLLVKILVALPILIMYQPENCWLLEQRVLLLHCLDI